MRLFWLLPVLFLAGCSPALLHVTPKRQQQLTQMIMQMDRSVDPSEARSLAREALRFSHTLAERYRVTTSPWVHNFLVNIHLRDRGLCYQWADDLLKDLAHLHSKTLRILPVGANIGSYWKEHNALVVLPAHHVTPLEYGILLDPWRHSGTLFFVPVEQDKKYQWKVRWKRLPKTAQGQTQ